MRENGHPPCWVMATDPDEKALPREPGYRSAGRTAPEPGKSFPLGATLGDGGANFSLFARRNAGVELLLFDGADDPEPARTIRLDARSNRSYHYWHVFVPGVVAGQVYGYRVSGPLDPAKG